MGEIEPILPGVSITRISPPPPTPHFLLRERLIDRLNRPAPRVTFAVAPGGFGKTVLASQWAAQAEGPVFWYSVDARDSARDSIFHIVQGLRLSIPHFAPWADELVNTEIDYVDVARKMANELGRVDHIVNLVWDGIDAISSEFTPALQAFDEMSPTNLRTLSLRTSMPMQSFARAAKLDALDFLTAADLRFDQNEIESILASHNIDPQDPEVKSEYEELHGWPAGIQMMVNRRTAGTETKSKSISEAYIISSTVKSISQRDREYLEQLVFLDEITLDLAQRIFHSPIISSEEHPLLRLSSQGIFLNEVVRGIYKMNPLIRQELIRELSVNRENMKNMALKSAQLLENENNPMAAIEIYSGADEDLAVRKIYFYLSRIINAGDAELLEKWSRRIAPLVDLGGTTRLNEEVFQAYIQLMRGKNLEVLATCASIESKYSTIKSPSLYVVELWGLKARAHFNLGNFKEVIRIAEEMLESEESKTDYGSAGIRMTNTLRIATSASFLRENYEALLRYSALINDPDDAVVKEVIMTATQSKVALAEGRYKRAFDFANIALKAARRHNITGVYASFDAAYVMSEYYRESGEYDLALEILNEFEPVAKAHGVWVWHIALTAKRALIYSSQNKINEALNILRSTRELYSGHEIDSEIFRILDEHELLIRVKLGDTERIGELLYRMPQTATTLAFSTAYAAMKNPSAAKSILSSYDVSNPRTELARELISAEVFKKYPSQALEHLQNAVAIAMSQGAKSVFLNQTSEVQDLLLRLANMQPTVYMEQLSAMIRKNQSDSLRDTMGLQEPLTKRELDILRRLSSGLPITKIAESLHISHNTIKTHLKSIYRKLAVESRKEAIERGVELFLF